MAGVVTLPAAVQAMAARGADWAAWIDSLPALTGDLRTDWALRDDGDPISGATSLVLPVRTAAGAAAMLKVGFPDAASEQEHLVLRRWDGDGAARLLRADPHRRALLIERLQHRNLHALNAVEACRIIAGLYRRLHVPALPQLRALTGQVERATAELATLGRDAPIPRRLVEQAIGLGTDLSADLDADLDAGGGGARVLHGDLHYAKVLAADRTPWLAIGPAPVNGDPHYEVAPLLWHRWDDLAGDISDDIRGGIRRRFHTVLEAAELDEDRARDWVIVRAVHRALRGLAAGSVPDQTRLTTCIAVAKAVQG